MKFEKIMDKQEILDGIKENAGAFIYCHYEELTDRQRKMILLCALDELHDLKGSKLYERFLHCLELYLGIALKKDEEEDTYDGKES